jgi:hypothetical protein
MSKITRAKRVKGVTQTVDHLPSKCKAPSSILSTTKGKTENKKKNQNENKQ